MLVDNKLAGQSFANRLTSGANLNPAVHSARFIPALTWPRFELMVRSSHFNGTLNFAVFSALTATSRQYPNFNHGGNAAAGSAGHWGIVELNGNTNNDVLSWVRGTGGTGTEMGTIWIGSSVTVCTAGCGYLGTRTGLGSDGGVAASGSTWVR